MDFEVLNDLLKIEKKSEAAKDKKESFYKEMIQLISEEGVGNKSMKYMKRGFSFCGAKPLADYILSLDESEQAGVLSEAVSSDVMKKNDSNIACKIEISILSSALNRENLNFDLIQLLIRDIPEKAKNKSGQFNKDIFKVVEKYFMRNLTDNTVLPDLSKLGLKPVFINSFWEFMTSALGKIEPSGKTTPKNIHRVKEWLGATRGLHIDEIAQPAENSPSESPVASSTDEVVKGVDKPEASDGKKCDGIENKPTNNFANIRRTVDTLFKQLNAEEKRVSEVENGNVQLRQRLATALNTVKASDSRIAGLNNNLSDQRARISELEQQIVSYKTQLLDKERAINDKDEQITELNQQIQKLKAVTSVYSEDKKNSQKEQLNAIALKLKSEYRDFLDAESMEMSVDLGENMREQLKAVFKILAKAGIDIEGR